MQLLFKGIHLQVTLEASSDNQAQCEILTLMECCNVGHFQNLRTTRNADGQFVSLQMVSNPGNPVFACQICGKRFTRRYSLKVHMNLHMGKYILQCDICKKGFNTSYSLRGHMNTIHTGVKEFKCDWCGKEYGYKHHLKQHKKSCMGVLGIDAFNSS
jgi:uncharacterized Zn-finger protein